MRLRPESGLGLQTREQFPAEGNGIETRPIPITIWERGIHMLLLS